MTIKEQSKSILEHPFFKDSLERANKGDLDGFDRLFYELMASTWEKVALEASRVYGQWHRGNSCDIKREIRNCPPPTTLDIRLPFVPPKETQPNVVIKTIHRHKTVLNNPNQLMFNFPEKTARHLKIA